jgi:hypothetical protein
MAKKHKPRGGHFDFLTHWGPVIAKAFIVALEWWHDYANHA